MSQELYDAWAAKARARGDAERKREQGGTFEMDPGALAKLVRAQKLIDGLNRRGLIAPGFDSDESAQSIAPETTEQRAELDDGQKCFVVMVRDEFHRWRTDDPSTLPERLEFMNPIVQKAWMTVAAHPAHHMADLTKVIHDLAFDLKGVFWEVLLSGENEGDESEDGSMTGVAWYRVAQLVSKAYRERRVLLNDQGWPCYLDEPIDEGACRLRESIAEGACRIRWGNGLAWQGAPEIRESWRRVVDQVCLCAPEDKSREDILGFVARRAFLEKQRGVSPWSHCSARTRSGWIKVARFVADALDVKR